VLTGLCTTMPSGDALAIVAMAALPMLAIPRMRLVAYVVAGFTISGFAANAALDDRLDADHGNDDWPVAVRIDDFPVRDGHSLRFTARPVGRPDLPAKIRLTWHLPETAPGFGEVWRLTLRLRRPHGYANPGGFDYEGWLFRERIGATGYVDEAGRNYRMHGAPAKLVDRQRSAVARRMIRLLPGDDAAAVLVAIVVGARHGISDERWEQFAATGTSHLMAISGLHVGLAAGSAWLLAWGLAAATAHRNPRDAALAGALMAAAGYSMLAGFAVPARRALVMLALATAALGMRRRVSPGRLLASACLVQLVSDPLSHLAPGFRLSFAAVAVLFLLAPSLRPAQSSAGIHRRAGTAVARLCALQFALMVGLFPLTVTEFGRFTLLALPVNLVVLPIFNFVTVPFALGGAVLAGIDEPAGAALLSIAHRSATVALRIIDFADAFDGLAFANLAQHWRLAAILPLLHVLLPAGWPGRRIAVLAIVTVLADRPAPPPPGCFDYHVLDVGQGLAVVVQSHEHALLFDTGPAFRNGGSAARFTVLPFLARQGIDRLDQVVVSHADMDHAGGIDDILTDIQVGRVYTSEPLARLGSAQTACASGVGWEWDGVRFDFLHPRRGSPWSGNDASCVLLVAAGDERLLLPGDIEAPAEILLAYRQMLPPAVAVVVPHHGSRTSSSASLVDATRPAIAIVAAGHGNRWGFPKADVTARWVRAGARVLNTASSGAVSQRICRDGGPLPPREARRDARRYWHDPPS